MGSEEFLEVDTTRPETIFGDVAVAVHPEDPRYQQFHGKHVVHPFSKELIPIVTDDILVNMELGTGAWLPMYCSLMLFTYSPVDIIAVV